jgi:hypothetical protein
MSNSASGFSDQWNKMFGNSEQTGPAATAAAANTTVNENMLGEPKKPSTNIVNDDNEFANFVSSSPFGAPGQLQTPSSDLMGLDDNRSSSHGQAFLPSQLFDLDQSLYSKQSTLSSNFISIFVKFAY